MPNNRPPTSGYARLAQEEEDEEYLDDSDQDGPKLHTIALSSPGVSFAPIQPGRRREHMQISGRASPSNRRSNLQTRPRRSNSGIDIKAINARLERWADEIASKFKIRRKGKGAGDEQLEIQHSVFQAPDGVRPATEEELITLYADPPGIRMSKAEFEDIVESVRVAIELGVHPKLISQGSSGSYFAKNSESKTVAVFKPKDEEPYASRNPKWTKWIHRNLFPCFFGRAMLIPNLSYISEAAAYVLDVQLRTNLVPYTDVVGLSSQSFFYDYWDRRQYYRKKKPLPEKLGSFQIFLRGYKDATVFLREHPWPDQHNPGFRDAPERRKKRKWADNCRPSGQPSEDEYEDHEDAVADEPGYRRAFWTEGLQQSLREELEKLVVLDYIMRNTDRGLDNWMIRIDEKSQRASILVDPAAMNDSGTADSMPPNVPVNITEEPYRRQERMTATSRSTTPSQSPERTVRIGAIDNSLSWPWKHPDAVSSSPFMMCFRRLSDIKWRSYPFGWLFLPVSLIGQPFSERTRTHFLPLLTSKAWWSETQMVLRQCFSMDADFQEKMFQRQIAVMKGQAWNVVETLKTADHGPLELTRRARVLVWDDVVEVPVAVPLRVPSPEMRRQHERRRREAQEEMDISSALASAPQPQHDLLGSPRTEFAPATGSTFNMSRQSSSMDVTRPSIELNGGPLSPDNINAMADGSPSRKERSYFSARPKQRPRMSFDEPRRVRDPVGGRSRRLSLSNRNNISSFPLAEDDLEGDLGYSAAEDRESNRKRVIVERLEPVKGKNPFFTWC